MSNTDPPAVKFKNEGNVLFAKKDYRAAHHKYTLAIKEDGNNAILYANRAACSHYLHKFLDASADALKATDIDPTYAKGWARHAAARGSLGDEQGSVNSWKKAIDALPKQNKTPAEVKQQEQYQADLTTMEKKLKTSRSHNERRAERGPPVTEETAPWTRAVALLPELQASQQVMSSAFVIRGALWDWEHGSKVMDKLTITAGGMAAGDRAIDSLSNAILRDSRIFALGLNSSSFFNKFGKQVLYESQVAKAWTSGGAQTIIPELVKRQQLEGWLLARRAINTTSRILIVRGFRESRVGNHAGAVEFIGCVLEIIRWGNKTWADVPVEDRGIMFDDSFMHGVHALYLEVLLEAASESPKKYLDLLRKEAQALLQCDVARFSDNRVDPGFIASFTTYPRATAFSALGYCHVQKSRRLEEANSEDKETIESFYQDAAKAYSSSAESYFEDDEKHMWMLICSLMCSFDYHAPLSATLPMMQQLRKCIPAVKTIWEFGKLYKKSTEHLETIMDFETRVRKAVDDGRLDMESVVRPGDSRL
ncbi:hypothetical protein EIP91_009675 [Steccherinum ochraceum]|uniref:Uncharacterized protein n=1 Tax=Steccherinum ochraceum TaxID=92696 RepID=A0A4R0RXF1_9APHY|nr:hypothetical protein EIP91_009675 [Steccherinum ochraceum]